MTTPQDDEVKVPVEDPPQPPEEPFDPTKVQPVRPGISVRGNRPIEER